MNVDIFSERIRKAADRFQRETGVDLASVFPAGPVEEAMVELFLIVRGYPPTDLPSNEDPC